MRKISDMKVGEKGFVNKCFHLESEISKGYMINYFSLELTENHTFSKTKNEEHFIPIKREDKITYTVCLAEMEYFLQIGEKINTFLSKDVIIKKYPSMTKREYEEFKQRGEEIMRGLVKGNGIIEFHNLKRRDALKWIEYNKMIGI